MKGKLRIQPNATVSTDYHVKMATDALHVARTHTHTKVSIVPGKERREIHHTLASHNLLPKLGHYPYTPGQRFHILVFLNT